ncbi:MAG: bifunctional riboflavin kinase/FAD synthetase [Bdellovibrionaceae bacterium]|nr:bifunctional riboflavin kinase/FAD synthetase [Pseudobdellovibrionaceae bacterium]
MQIFQGVEDLPPDWGSSVVSIGNFDGIHLGHQNLLKQALAEGEVGRLPVVVMTFNPHPVSILYPEKKIQRLFDFRDQREQLSKLGVSFLIEQEFTQNFAQLTAADFVQFFLIEKLKTQTLVVGYDFSFGTKREGTVEFLRKICEKMKVKLVVVPPYFLGDEVVSSSRVREQLREGAVEAARDLLGREFYLRGLVRHGEARGRTIGVPTANMTPTVDFVPRKGVYVTRTHLRQQWHYSITNIGFNPTFVSNLVPQVKAETHILDFNEDIYGQEIQVDVLKFLRDEKKFSDIQSLVAQIRVDIDQAREFFRGQS